MTVIGQLNPDGVTGVALEILEENELQGPVEAVTATGLVVLGQTVTVDAATLFDPTDYPTGLAAVAVGDLVEAHGLRGAANEILATRIERDGVFAPGATVELRGIVSSVLPGALNIGTQVVDTVIATTSGEIVDGALVEVKGTLAAIGGIIIATSLEVEDEHLPTVAGAKVELEGVISALTSVADFTVGGQAVDASTAVFTGGTAADLAVGRRVEVEGVIDGTILRAREVDLR